MDTKFAALSVVLAALVGTASAAEKGMVGFLDSTAATCMAREYDDAHMKAHPKQKVTGIAFTYAPVAAEDAAEGAITGALVVTLKGSKTRLYGSAYCKSGKGSDVECIIDEDGGSFRLVETSKGGVLENKNRIMVMPNLDDYDAALAARVNVDPKDDQEAFLFTSYKSDLCKID